MCLICSGGHKNLSPVIKELNCSGCPTLERIPVLKNITQLICSGCPKLRQIQPGSKFKLLECANCPKLKKIPASNTTYMITCNGCSDLEEIGLQPLLVGLVCSNCPKLKEIPYSGYLEELDCNGCSSITSIQAVYDTDYVSCENCLNLRSISAVNGSKCLIRCYNCPLIESHPFPDGIAFISKCYSLKGSIDWAPNFLDRVLFLQKWLKKIVFLIRLEKLVQSSTFLGIYYAPGNNGYTIAFREYHKKSEELKLVKHTLHSPVDCQNPPPESLHFQETGTTTGN